MQRSLRDRRSCNVFSRFLSEVLHHLDSALGIQLSVEDGAPVPRRAQAGLPGAGFLFKGQDWRNAASGEAVKLDRGTWLSICVEQVESALRHGPVSPVA